MKNLRIWNESHVHILLSYGNEHENVWFASFVERLITPKPSEQPDLF